MALDNLCSFSPYLPVIYSSAGRRSRRATTSEERCVRPAVSERHAETLRTAEGNVPPQLTRRSQERSERRSGAAAH
jgi:hypothetical protein